MKLIHLTDTHLVEPGGRIYGLDPLQRLRRAVASINAEHADAALCIVTGDLAHFGEPAAYAALGEALAGLGVPVHLALGNHDNRVHFRAAFPGAPIDADGFVQFAIDSPVGRLLVLDTNEPGVPHGVYCERRAAWLAATLAERPQDPAWLFMHHPPFAIGIPTMDRIGLLDPALFAGALEPHRSRVRQLFFGHVHRPIAGSWRGIPISTVRGTCHQVALEFGARTRILGSHEPPAYAVVLAECDGAIVHLHDYEDRSERFDL